MFTFWFFNFHQRSILHFLLRYLNRNNLINFEMSTAMEVPDSQSAAAQPQPPQTKRYSVDSDYFEPYRPSSIESSVKPYVILCQHIQEKIDELQRVECDHERAVAHAELLCLPREKFNALLVGNPTEEIAEDFNTAHRRWALCAEIGRVRTALREEIEELVGLAYDFYLIVERFNKPHPVPPPPSLL